MKSNTKTLHVVWKSGSNSITILANSFTKAPGFKASVFSCHSYGVAWIRELINISGSFEIVHFHNILCYNAIPFLRLFRPGIKTVITVHDIGFGYNRQMNGLMKALLLEVIAIVGHLFSHISVFVSNSARKKNWLRFVCKRSLIILNGVRDDSVPHQHCLEPSIKRNTLGFIGNQFYVKGMDRLIRFPLPVHVELHLFGDICRGASPKDLAVFQSWKLKSHNVYEHGHVHFKVISDFFSSGHSVLLLLSTYEACPISVIQCMQWGVPVIATRLPIFNEYGLDNLVEFIDEDPESLSTAIKNVQRNYDLISKGMVKRYNEKFTPEHYWNNHKQMYESLLR